MQQIEGVATSSACLAAEYYGEFRLRVHHGAEAGDRRAIVYGNDGYEGDPRTRKQVRLVRERATGLGLVEESFGTSADGYSWAVVYRVSPPADAGDAAEALDGLVWRAWEEARGLALTP
jgi:hypothetical protein